MIGRLDGRYRAAARCAAWYNGIEEEEVGEHPIRAKTMPSSFEIDGPSVAMRSMVHRRRAGPATFQN